MHQWKCKQKWCMEKSPVWVRQKNFLFFNWLSLFQENIVFLSLSLIGHNQWIKLLGVVTLNLILIILPWLLQITKECRGQYSENIPCYVTMDYMYEKWYTYILLKQYEEIRAFKVQKHVDFTLQLWCLLYISYEHVRNQRCCSKLYRLHS